MYKLTINHWVLRCTMYFTAALLIGGLVSGCRSKPEIKPPIKGNIYIKSNMRLNWYNDRSHTVQVRFFQLMEKRHFDTPCKDLLADKYDSSKVVGETLDMIVFPGKDQTVDIQRAEGAKYLGVVAGFYKPEGHPPRCKAIQEFPDQSFDVTITMGPQGIDQIIVTKAEEK